MYVIAETTKNFYLQNDGTFGYVHKDARKFATKGSAITFAKNIRTPTQIVLLH